MSGHGFADPAGVLFVEDFDEAPGQQEAPIDVAPVYTVRDVEEAREDGRLAGIEEARADECAIQAALHNAALGAIGDGLANARADTAVIAQRGAEEIAGAILALLGAALPATAARLAPREVSALLAALLPPLSRNPDVRVRLHPRVLAGVGAELARFATVTAEPDEALADCDVIVTWQDGEARRDWAALWAQLSVALSPFQLPAELAHPTGG